MFVAPVTVGDGAYTGAGTVVRDDVPPGALAVSAGPQRNIEGWVERKRPGSARPPRPPARPKSTGDDTDADDNSDVSRSSPLLASGNPATRGQLRYVRLAPISIPDRRRAHCGHRLDRQPQEPDAVLGSRAPRTGRAGRQGTRRLGHRADRARLRQRRDLRPLRRVGARLRRVRAAEPSRAAEPVADGTADHDRRAQARQRQADHRDPAVLSRTPVRTRSTAAASPSRRAWSPTCYKTAGADRIVTVDLHTDQIQGFFDGPVDHMRAQTLLCGYIAENYADHDMVVVSPDSGRVRVAEKWADSLGGVPLAFIHKTRDPLVPNQVKSQPRRRRRRGQDLHPHRRHDRHRRHHRGSGQAAARRTAQRTSSSPPPTACCPILRRSGWPSAAPARSSSPTRCRSARTSSSRS